MIVYPASEVPQGSMEWFALHVGIPSAGGYDKILTPKTRQLSKSVADYRNRLLADWLLGARPEDVQNAWMQRGHALEARARAWYTWEHGKAVEEVGFVMRDDRLTGCSPDGMVGDDGIIEIKCLSAANHIGYLLDPVDDYMTQVHGQLWVTGRKWCDRITYNPALPSVVRRIERDEAYIADLAAAVETFLVSLVAARERLIAMGIKPGGHRCPDTEIDRRICRCPTCQRQRSVA